MNSEKEESTISTAYALSLKSVEISIRRFDNQDANLEKIITWIITFSTALLTFIGSGKVITHVDYQSYFFVIGVGCLIASLSIAFIGKFSGEISSTNPKKLYEDRRLEDDLDTFKKDHIYYFGEDCEGMDEYTKKKWLFGLIAILLFSFELIAFVAWVIQSTTS